MESLGRSQGCQAQFHAGIDRISYEFAITWPHSMRPALPALGPIRDERPVSRRIADQALPIFVGHRSQISERGRASVTITPSRSSRCLAATLRPIASHLRDRFRPRAKPSDRAGAETHVNGPGRPLRPLRCLMPPTPFASRLVGGKQLPVPATEADAADQPFSTSLNASRAFRKASMPEGTPQ